ncbi:serine protease 27 [Megalobrama amblycephala]|uniref:serine protease 27 n=1 Tax=Megalobrama amblycephala TaxID=75352 RepID=UPI0020143972|nr:serine protease 27 [Megalobrama amblycephala]
MKFNTVFCVAGAILLNIAGSLGQLDVCGEAPLNTKIVGGQNAIAGSWPWQASIQNASSGRYFCSGSLISKEWVLSLADCFIGISESDLLVYLGRLTQNGSNPHETNRTVIKIIKHPKYVYSHDQKLALLQLSSPVTFTDYIKPVCLAAAGSIFVDGTESWVTGWGTVSANVLKLPDILQELETPVVNNFECDAAYGGIITNNLICAGFFNEGEKTPCVGDGGSPLVSRQGSKWIQSGVSVYSGCGLSENPAIYVRVSEYQDWISYYTNSSMPGFVPFPLILYIGDGASIILFPFSLALAFSIIPLIFFHVF